MLNFRFRQTFYRLYQAMPDAHSAICSVSPTANETSDIKQGQKGENDVLAAMAPATTNGVARDTGATHSAGLVNGPGNASGPSKGTPSPTSNSTNNNGSQGGDQQDASSLLSKSPTGIDALTGVTEAVHAMFHRDKEVFTEEFFQKLVSLVRLTNDYQRFATNRKTCWMENIEWQWNHGYDNFMEFRILYRLNEAAGDKILLFRFLAIGFFTRDFFNAEITDLANSDMVARAFVLVVLRCPSAYNAVYPHITAMVYGAYDAKLNRDAAMISEQQGIIDELRAENQGLQTTISELQVNIRLPSERPESHSRVGTVDCEVQTIDELQKENEALRPCIAMLNQTQSATMGTTPASEPDAAEPPHELSHEPSLEPPHELSPAEEASHELSPADELLRGPPPQYLTSRNWLDFNIPEYEYKQTLYSSVHIFLDPKQFNIKIKRCKRSGNTNALLILVFHCTVELIKQHDSVEPLPDLLAYMLPNSSELRSVKEIIESFNYGFRAGVDAIKQTPHDGRTMIDFLAAIVYTQDEIISRGRMELYVTTDWRGIIEDLLHYKVSGNDNPGVVNPGDGHDDDNLDDDNDTREVYYLATPDLAASSRSASSVVDDVQQSDPGNEGSKEDLVDDTGTPTAAKAGCAKNERTTPSIDRPNSDPPLPDFSDAENATRAYLAAYCCGPNYYFVAVANAVLSNEDIGKHIYPALDEFRKDNATQYAYYINDVGWDSKKILQDLQQGVKSNDIRQIYCFYAPRNTDAFERWVTETKFHDFIEEHTTRIFNTEESNLIREQSKFRSYYIGKILFIAISERIKGNKRLYNNTKAKCKQYYNSNNNTKATDAAVKKLIIKLTDAEYGAAEFRYIDTDGIMREIDCTTDALRKKAYEFLPPSSLSSTNNQGAVDPFNELVCKNIGPVCFCTYPNSMNKEDAHARITDYYGKANKCLSQGYDVDIMLPHLEIRENRCCSIAWSDLNDRIVIRDYTNAQEFKNEIREVATIANKNDCSSIFLMHFIDPKAIVFTVPNDTFLARPSLYCIILGKMRSICYGRKMSDKYMNNPPDFYIRGITKKGINDKTFWIFEKKDNKWVQSDMYTPGELERVVTETIDRLRAE